MEYQDLNPKAWAGRIYRKYTTSGGQILSRYIVAILASDGNPARVYAANGALLSSTGEAATDDKGVLDVYVLADDKYKVMVLHPSSRARIVVEEGIVASINVEVAVPELDSSELRQVRGLLAQSPVTPTYPSSTTFEYTSGKLTKITYADGTVKNLAYNVQGKLDYIDTVTTSGTVRKTFVRDINEKLSSIVETTV